MFLAWRVGISVVPKAGFVGVAEGWACGIRYILRFSLYHLILPAVSWNPEILVPKKHESTGKPGPLPRVQARSGPDRRRVKEEHRTRSGDKNRGREINAGPHMIHYANQGHGSWGSCQIDGFQSKWRTWCFRPPSCEVKYSDWARRLINNGGMKQNTYLHLLGNNSERAGLILRKAFGPCHLSTAKSQLCAFASKNMHLLAWVLASGGVFGDICVGKHCPFVLLVHGAQRCWGMCCL